MRRRVLVVVVAAVLLLGAAATAVSSDLFESPSEGQQFQYFGTAFDDTDPDQAESSDNDVAHFDTTSGLPVGLRRNVGELVRELDNQLGFRYFMANRSCGAGSPRVQLAVDTDGDGVANGNLHGHVRPPYTCAEDKWVYEDLTDDELRWEVGVGLPGTRAFPHRTWTEIEALLGNALVLTGALIEDSQAFAESNRGHAYYDLVSIGNRTFEDHNDTAR
ncbi:MAG TPA: hypothetical protein VHF47_03035 [Acidimicrobiales bacterium]|nr:hypothetical protein [Acidimicrobiales bacterium]